MHICVTECIRVYHIHAGCRESARSPEMHSLAVTKVLETEFRSSSRSVSIVNQKIIFIVTYFLLINTHSWFHPFLKYLNI